MPSTGFITLVHSFNLNFLDKKIIIVKIIHTEFKIKFYKYSNVTLKTGLDIVTFKLIHASCKF